VRVREDAGNGVAKVTVQIPDWKEQVLAPASFAVPLDHAAWKVETAKPWKAR
jgi:hypothetical protein